MSVGKAYGFINGVIYPSFKPLIRARGLAIFNGKVVYVGDESKVKSIVRDLGGDVYNLEGTVIVPGFIDSHLHLHSYAISFRGLNLRGIRSISDLKKKLKEYIEANPNVKLIFGRGWDQEEFVEGRWPTRFDIDDVVPDKPVILIRVCGHAALLNTKAMEELGLFKIKSDDLVTDEKGIPIGIVKESLLQRVSEYMDHMLGDDTEMLNALRSLASQGITTIGYISARLRHIVKLLELKRRLGYLPLRVFAYLSLGDFMKLINVIPSSFGDDYVKVIGVKVFADGSLGARTAYLSSPYDDDPNNRGQLLISENELSELVIEALSKGFQVAAHAIGDAALDVVLKAYS
ncbi:MAG TPA: amidohydrolase, partial [Acidilobales archaeon]|nr:amidohydrolase [Acidilobales archaeon]